MKFLRVTEVLALAGAVDYSFCTDEGKWRGSEVHRAAKLSLQGTLKSVPQKLEGYMTALLKFRSECSFIPSLVEHEVESKELHLRGRMDTIGVLRGASAIIDFKTGEILEATGLQLCLYGHMHQPGKWWDRYGIQLRENGTYRAKQWPRVQWATDLATALACVRVAHWRLANGLVKA